MATDNEARIKTSMNAREMQYEPGQGRSDKLNLTMREKSQYRISDAVNEAVST